MQTVLICGGREGERSAKAKELAQGVSREDLIILKTQNTLGIGEIRELEHRLSLKPYSSPFKACILENAENLTIPAQNALLKTLEEPPENTLIILSAPNSESLLQTIVSRCQIINLSAKTELILDDKIISNQLTVLELALSDRVGGRLKAAAGLGKDRKDLIIFFDQQTLIWHNILLQKLKIIKEGVQFRSEKLSSLTIGQLVRILKDLEKTKQMVKGNVNARLAVEIFFLDLPGLKI